MIETTTELGSLQRHPDVSRAIEKVIRELGLLKGKVDDGFYTDPAKLEALARDASKLVGGISSATSSRIGEMRRNGSVATYLNGNGHNGDKSEDRNAGLVEKL
jgi:hypothetical protein